MPPTATPEEMQADLDAMVAEIKRYALMNLIAMSTGLICGLSIIVMMMLAG